MSEASKTSETAGEFDLSKYQTAELVENITEIINVPGGIWEVFKTAFFAIIFAGILMAVIRALGIAAGVEWFLISIYSIVIAIVFGFLLGLLRVVYSCLINVDEVLKQILNISEHAADDVAALHSGQQQSPPGNVLISKVYDEVVMPTVETVVSESLGILGKPILWIYRRTIGSAVRYVIKQSAIKKSSSKSAEKLRHETKKTLNELVATEETKSYLQRAREIVSTIGTGLRLFAIRPLFVIYVVLLILALLPIIAVLCVF